MTMLQWINERLSLCLIQKYFYFLKRANLYLQDCLVMADSIQMLDEFAYKFKKTFEQYFQPSTIFHVLKPGHILERQVIRLVWLKTQRFSDVFRGYSKRPVAWNGLIKLYKVFSTSLSQTKLNYMMKNIALGQTNTVNC